MKSTLERGNYIEINNDTQALLETRVISLMSYLFSDGPLHKKGGPGDGGALRRGHCHRVSRPRRPRT